MPPSTIALSNRFQVYIGDCNDGSDRRDRSDRSDHKETGWYPYDC